MNNADKFKMAAKSALISAVVVPAIGIAAHLMPGKGTFFLDDASLSHRFECAYSLNPNPDHKTYTSYETKERGTYFYAQDVDGGLKQYVDGEGNLYNDTWIEEGPGGYDTLYSEERYAAHPFLICPLHLAVAGVAYAAMRRRREEMAESVNVAQKTK